MAYDERHPDRRTVTLRSGGTVQLAVSLDVLNASPADLKLIQDVLDLVRAYEARPSGEV